MPLNSYLRRIGLQGPLPPTLDTLHAVHRAQAYAIPYEGLDVQLGVPLDLNPKRIFDKLVVQGRGGWCFETNGLLAWALGELGFEVQRCIAGVYRRERGDSTLGNHVTLLVRLGEPWLCDLGLGCGLRAPIPLAEGRHRDGGLEFRLERLTGGFWRFHNHPAGSPTSFDFRPDPADEGLFHRQNILLQTSPESHFVQNAEAVRMGPGWSITLLGRVLRHWDGKALHKTVLDSPLALALALEQHFDLRGIDTERLWPRIEARHRALFGD